MNSRPLPLVEFVILVAVLFSLVAFGTDAMLPALPDIAADLDLDKVNHAQLVVTSFILGSGIGQMLFGPLSDMIGRKPALFFGIMLFVATCFWALWAESLTAMLIARFLQGFGISAPRTVTIAMVRDLFEGRAMAQVMSFAMAVFILVPAVAPALGQVIMQAYGWRAIYTSFIIFALFSLVWLYLRQPESHPQELHRRMSWPEFRYGFHQVLTTPQTFWSMVIVGLVLGALFSYLSSAQQIFVDSFGVGGHFPAFFAAVALGAGLGAVANGAMVTHFGMRFMCTLSQVTTFVLSAGILAVALYDISILKLPLYTFWSVSMFCMMSLTLGNLNALAMEPMGRIAGLAAAIVGTVSTVMAVMIAIPVGLAFDGTPVRLVSCYLVTSLLALILLRRI